MQKESSKEQNKYSDEYELLQLKERLPKGSKNRNYYRPPKYQKQQNDPTPLLEAKPFSEAKRNKSTPCLNILTKLVTCLSPQNKGVYVKNNDHHRQNSSKSRTNTSNDITMETHNGSVSLSNEKKFPSLLWYKEIKFVTTGDKFNYHMDIIEIIAIFAQRIPKEGKEDPWGELRYLLNKKGYLQRKKAEKFLKKYPIVSPFKLKQATITTAEMLQYMKLTTGKFRLNQLINENKKLQTILKEKHGLAANSGVLINMLNEQQQMNRLILKRIWEYALHIEADKKRPSLQTDIKICECLLVGFIVRGLQGEGKVGLESVEEAIRSNSVKKHVEISKKLYIQNIYN